jgi:hypothetical protein
MIIKFEKKDKVIVTKAYEQFSEVLKELPDGLYQIEITKPKRTSKQNRALHLFFHWFSQALNEKGIMFNYTVLNKEFACEYTPYIVKEHIWRIWIRALYGQEKTSKLTTRELSQAVDKLRDNLSLNYGIILNFPSFETLVLNINKCEI